MELLFALLAGLPLDSQLTADGLGPLRIGMPLASVNRILQHPIVPTPKALRVAANCDYRNLEEAPGVSLVFIDGKLARIDVTGGPTSTGHGIRVGAPLAQAQEKYPAAVTEKLDYVDDGVNLMVASPQSPNALSLQFESPGLTRMVAGRKQAVRYAEGCD